MTTGEARWLALFADLEAQSAARLVAERAAQVDERSRIETGEVRWLERLRSSLGATVRVRLAGEAVLGGRLERVGPDWLLLAELPGREVLVAAEAVRSVRGLDRYADASTSQVAARLGLRHALRGVARDRSPVRLLLRDGGVLEATLDRVGADFVEVATHAPGELRRRGAVSGTEVVPLAALAAVTRLAPD